MTHRKSARSAVSTNVPSEVFGSTRFATSPTAKWPTSICPPIICQRVPARETYISAIRGCHEQNSTDESKMNSPRHSLSAKNFMQKVIDSEKRECYKRVEAATISCAKLGYKLRHLEVR